MGLNDYDTTNTKWGLSLATSGDRYLATSGDFPMARYSGRVDGFFLDIGLKFEHE